MSSIVLLGPDQAIERRRQNPDHSYTRRNVVVFNRSCSHCNQLSPAHVRSVHTFCFRLRPHYAGPVWKRSFISIARSTVCTNSSWQQSFSKKLFKPEEFVDGKLLGRACDCQVLSQLVCFQISPAPAKCGRGYNKKAQWPKTRRGAHDKVF